MDAYVILILVSSFVVNIVLVSVLYCVWTTAPEEDPDEDEEEGGNPRTNSGLDPSVIDSLCDGYVTKGEKTVMECAICLEEVEEKAECRTLPVCEHCFHKQCVDSWLVKKATCPLCRRRLLEEVV
ncbi:putative RING-H2 finger protein ATL61 [Aristolochia californica]|uniref:putative RING-H2 finger protein ATL61 n=1 Tax=Aristolochia californica TaxID=171875 RepID=UPI0035D8CBAC